MNEETNVKSIGKVARGLALLDRDFSFYSDYDEAVRKSQEVANRIGAKTSVNYVPHDVTIVLRGESYVRRSLLLERDPRKVLGEAVGFVFVVVGFGPRVKGLEMGDIIDIKSTQGLSLRPFIPHRYNMSEWYKILEKDKAATIGRVIEKAESGRVVGAAMVKDAERILRNSGDVNYNEEVLVVEHFVTEEFNISGIYHPMKI